MTGRQARRPAGQGGLVRPSGFIFFPQEVAEGLKHKRLDQNCVLKLHWLLFVEIAEGKSGDGGGVGETQGSVHILSACPGPGRTEPPRI